MAERVGLVGLGLMGHAMSKNMLAAGFAVQGFDLAADRVALFEEMGGEAVGSPAEAARGVDTVILSLPNSDIVRAVVTGPDGVLEGASEGLVIVDTTTSRPEDSAAMAEELAPRGYRFLDAAVSGTSVMAEEKDLIVIAGGEAEDFETAREVMGGFSRAAYYMGPSGSGALTKLIINLVLMGNRFALMEGMLLGMKAGVDESRLLSVLKDGASGSKTMDQKGQKLIDGEYTPQGALWVATKDSGLMMEQGRKHGTPMFLATLYNQLATSQARMGDDTLDSSSVFEMLREMAGMERRV